MRNYLKYNYAKYVRNVLFVIMLTIVLLSGKTDKEDAQTEVELLPILITRGGVIYDYENLELAAFRDLARKTREIDSLLKELIDDFSIIEPSGDSIIKNISIGMNHLMDTVRIDSADVYWYLYTFDTIKFDYSNKTD